MRTSEQVAEDMRELDQRVKRFAARMAGIHAEEARLLREVEESRLWHWLGMVSLAAYVEARFGVGVHAAHERLRVARALEALPLVESALACGELAFGHVRELTRVATPETEAEWLDHTTGQTAHQVQRAISGHVRGDRPGDRRRSEVMTERVWFEVTPAQAALLRQARAALDEERGEHLEDGAVLEALCRTSLERPDAVDPSGTRPAYQVAITRCPDCERSTQNGSGIERDLTMAEAERARCDAEVMVPGERVTATVSPALRRRVFARDRYRCVVPGCRSARNLDLHHVMFQSHGGRHELSNLCLTCSAHHAACHDGKLTITGLAPALAFAFHRDGCDDRDQRIACDDGGGDGGGDDHRHANVPGHRGPGACGCPGVPMPISEALAVPAGTGSPFVPCRAGRTARCVHRLPCQVAELAHPRGSRAGTRHSALGARHSALGARRPRPTLGARRPAVPPVRDALASRTQLGLGGAIPSRASSRRGRASTPPLGSIRAVGRASASGARHRVLARSSGEWVCAPSAAENVTNHESAKPGPSPGCPSPFWRARQRFRLELAMRRAYASAADLQIWPSTPSWTAESSVGCPYSTLTTRLPIMIAPVVTTGGSAQPSTL